MPKLINDDNLAGNKRFWSYIKSKPNNQSGIPTLEKDNKTYTDNVDKANILNDHFSSVFTIDNSSIDQMPLLDSSPLPNIPPLYIEAEGIKRLLNNLNVHKSHGPDGIPARFLKEKSDSISPVLALIFNASLHQGKLPIDWKNAFVVPIFKKGLRTDPTNYRPISLTCICCKVFEHIVVSSVSAHANLHNTICKEQHGFQKHYSHETQLLETVHDLTSSLNAGKQIDLLLLDFSKAFDKVSHQRLLYKPSHLGIRGPLHH